ncbi:MAG: alpha/beta hydrolase [Nitrospinae bacterium]|nr:alpha/beta hydrolase [Nitrospinota bacterium]
MKNITIAGRNCFESGEGNTIFIFFHGWAGNHTVWNLQRDFFQGKRSNKKSGNLSGIKVVTVDLFNHFSDFPDTVQDKTFGQFYSDKLFQIIEYYRGYKIIPVFWSMSTLLYLELLKVKKQLPINRAVIVAGTCKFIDDEQKTGMHSVGFKKMYSSLEKWYPESIIALAEGYFSGSGELQWMKNYKFPPRLGNLLDQLNYLEITDLTSVLSSINIPVDIIHGTEDKVIPLGMGLFLRERIPSSTLHIVDGGCHNLMIDSHLTVNKKLSEITLDKTL